MNNNTPPPSLISQAVSGDVLVMVLLVLGIPRWEGVANGSLEYLVVPLCGTLRGEPLFLQVLAGLMWTKDATNTAPLKMEEIPS